MKRRILLIVIDAFFVLISFLMLAWIKPGTRSVVIPEYRWYFLIFLFVWVLASVVLRKYEIKQYQTIRGIYGIIFLSNFLVLAAMAILMFLLKEVDFSRLLVFGTIGIATFLELILAYFIHAGIKSPVLENGNGLPVPKKSADRFPSQIPDIVPGKTDIKVSLPGEVISMIKEEYGAEVSDLIARHSLHVEGPLRVVSTTTKFNLVSLSQEKYGLIVNLHRINDIQRINKFFEAANSKLSHGGIFIGKSETNVLRKQRILKKYFYPLNYLFYTVDYIFKRVFPKVPGLKQIYFLITRGRNRLLSRAETLGRLYSCGFAVVNEQYIGNEFYFVARKNGHPEYPKNPTYGPFVRLKRVGKGGALFTVYKMRTMHPYAEYLQAYIYEKSKLETGGKFRDDFRVNTVGRVMRKIWLDEIPMLINIFKGDMKIVGVRPLSQHYFNLYTKELQEKRIRYKPGLIPPFYADLPQTLEEIMASEMKYLEEYQKHPLRTDIRYFFAAWHNIIFKKARSN